MFKLFVCDWLKYVIWFSLIISGWGIEGFYARISKLLEIIIRSSVIYLYIFYNAIDRYLRFFFLI